MLSIHKKFGLDRLFENSYWKNELSHLRPKSLPPRVNSWVYDFLATLRVGAGVGKASDHLRS